jgi:hypothetical protein
MSRVRARQTLPEGYREAGTLKLAGNKRLIYGVTVAAFAVLGVCCLALSALAGAVRPELAGFSMTFSTAGEAFTFMGVLLGGLALVPALVCVVHELMHGLGFWFFTRSRPRYGFTGWYAYATAPGWFLPRNQMLLVILAPLVTITVVGLAVVLVAPPPVAMFFLYGVALDASGAVGDVYFAVHLLRTPPTTIVEDRHDSMTWYREQR